METNNITASAYCNSILRQKRSENWDIGWYWLKDRVHQGQFITYWDRGSNNLADYHTKHFPPSYHIKIRPKYILKGFHLSTNLRECVFPYN